MKINGILIVVEDIITTKDFKRRKFVLEHSDKGYIQYITFELFQSHCNLLEAYKIGDKIAVDFSVNGRKWVDKEGEEKYFNTLQAWKIQKDNSED